MSGGGSRHRLTGTCEKLTPACSKTPPLRNTRYARRHQLRAASYLRQILCHRGGQLLTNRILKVEQKLFNLGASGFITYRFFECAFWLSNQGNN